MQRAPEWSSRGPGGSDGDKPRQQSSRKGRGSKEQDRRIAQEDWFVLRKKKIRGNTCNSAQSRWRSVGPGDRDAANGWEREQWQSHLEG